MSASNEWEADFRVLGARAAAETSEAKRLAAEAAFAACPWWRLCKRERLRRERTSWRLWASADRVRLAEVKRR